MGLVDNNYVDMIYLLPDEIEVAVNKSWCCSVVSFLDDKELYDELIHMINKCIGSDEHRHDSPGNVNKHVMMSVGIVKRILNICGKDTLTFYLPHNYKQLSNHFLCAKLGDTKEQIERLVNSEDYELALNFIDTIVDSELRHLALTYMKSIYLVQTEHQINALLVRRREFLKKIASKKSQLDNC